MSSNLSSELGETHHAGFYSEQVRFELEVTVDQNFQNKESYGKYFLKVKISIRKLRKYFFICKNLKLM